MAEACATADARATLSGGNESAASPAITGEVLHPTPRAKIDLRNLEAVRREMGKVYREMRSGELQPESGTRLVYVLDRIGKLIEVEQIEQRLIELERKLLK